MPQVPDDFDALTMVALMAAHTSRIELGTAVVPLQAQHPIALARQALSVHAMASGRLARRRPVAPLDRAGHARHPLREARGVYPRLPRGAQRRDRRTGPVDVENKSFTVHNPTVLGAETPMPVLVAALGPVMLQIAGEHADGTVLDGRREGHRRLHRAEDQQGRRRGGPSRAAHRRGYPVCLCANSEIDAAKERANAFSPKRRRRRTISGCSIAAMPVTSAICAPRATRTRS